MNQDPNIIYFDLETTGLNQYHDKITDVCFIRENFNNQELPLKFSCLVNPEKKISDFITRLTGISNQMVQDKPNFAGISQGLLSFIQPQNNKLSTPYLVAHNAEGFDKLVLRIHFKNCQVNTNLLPWKYLDTLLLAKKLYPYMFKHNLKKLMTELGLEVREAHRAENDTLMLRDLYHKLCLDLAKKEKLNYESVIQNPEYVWQYIHN